MSPSPEDHRDAAVSLAEHASRAVDEGELRVGDLRLLPLAAQLPHGLDHEEDAAHAGVVRREAAAVGIDRQRAAEPDAAAGTEGAPLARLAEPERLERREYRDRVGVVDHAAIDVVVPDPGARERQRTGLPGRDVEEIVPPDAEVTDGFGAAEDRDGAFREIARALHRGEDQR